MEKWAETEKATRAILFTMQYCTPSVSEAKPRKMEFAQIWWRGVFLGVVFEFPIKKPL